MERGQIKANQWDHCIQMNQLISRQLLIPASEAVKVTMAIAFCVSDSEIYVKIFFVTTHEKQLTKSEPRVLLRQVFSLFCVPAFKNVV